MKALVWPVAAYGCESWTLRKADEKKINSFENTCARRVLGISWVDKITNVTVWEKLKEKPSFLEHIKRRKLGYFGHIIRQQSHSIEAAVMTGLVPGTRSRGRPRTAWIDNIIDWSGLKGTQMLNAARDRGVWRNIVHQCDQPSPARTVDE